MGNEERKQSRSAFAVYALMCLTVAVILLRMATGKYDEAYFHIFLWAAATLAVPACLVYMKGSQLSRLNWSALIFYSVLVFVCCLLLQPMLWFFGKIGFIPFFSYSLLVLLPIEALILWPIARKTFIAAAIPQAGFAPSDLDLLDQIGLKSQAELLVKKLNRLREALAIETDPERKFQYEAQIEQIEKDIAGLRHKLHL
jgi:hypothetical protein